MGSNRTSNDMSSNGKLHGDVSEHVSSTMEYLEMEDEDGPLLSQSRSGHRKNITSCFTSKSILSPLRRQRLRMVIAVSGFLTITLVAIHMLLFAGDPFKSMLHIGTLDSQFSSSNISTDSGLKNGDSNLLAMGHSYVQAIMTPEDTSFPRLDCPSPSLNRYASLQNSSNERHESERLPSYFFALDLHQCVGVLPRLMGSIFESIRFLGPENCALSIVEGRSDDGTFEVLKLLRDEIEAMGVRYFFASNEIDPGADNNANRIDALAELRNIALLPLVKHVETYSADVTVIFINDVAICMEDILELVYQRKHLEADMTCAMDWTFVGHDPTFYDVWVARGMNGDSFFNIPADGNWNSAWNLFWNNPVAQQRQREGQPFQVFSCWNGAVVFTAQPLIKEKIRFRGPREDECFQGEPKIFAKDMWYHGYKRIAVIPSVNLEYSDGAARKIKAQKGYVSRWVEKGSPDADSHIEWDNTPPDKVRCIPSYGNQTWPPWDEAM
ncbi:hypothetical protein MMC09_003567 [Bachmanniomyces sp. S44760]|nr:hypothetical protein [Bachmanniomyces sp. S44760]